MQTADRVPAVHRASGKALHMAFDLGDKYWHIAFGDGSGQRFVTVTAGDLAGLELEIDRAKKRFKLSSSIAVYSCYEAGRDGFWLHRRLESQGITNLVVDPASIEASRRKKQAKTDRIDARKLLRKLVQYLGGDHDVWSVLHVPTREQEHERRLMRHRSQLQDEINAHVNRIRSLLVLQGVKLKRVDESRLQQCMSSFGPAEQQELQFQMQRLTLAREQLEILQSQLKAPCPQPCSRSSTAAAVPKAGKYAREVHSKVQMLTQLKAVGETSARTLVTEFFWRDFHNRREVGAAAGLTSTPHNSGNSEREQGISKAGNSRIRDMMVELSWLWLRWQPQSQLSQWFNARWAVGKRRRKVGIVAVARRLLIALWRYLEDGVVPEGATLKPRQEAA